MQAWIRGLETLTFLLLRQTSVVEHPYQTRAATGLFTDHATIFNWWTAWRSLWIANNKCGADYAFALVAWELWKERNAIFFRGVSTELQQISPLSSTRQVNGFGRCQEPWLSVQCNNLET